MPGKQHTNCANADTTLPRSLAPTRIARTSIASEPTSDVCDGRQGQKDPPAVLPHLRTPLQRTPRLVVAVRQVAEKTIVQIVKCLVHGCSIEGHGGHLRGHVSHRGISIGESGPSRRGFPPTAIGEDHPAAGSCGTGRTAWPVRATKKGTLEASTATARTGKRRSPGRTWIHAALVGTSRFLIDLRIGPRTLEMAVALVASAAACARRWRR